MWRPEVDVCIFSCHSAFLVWDGSLTESALCFGQDGQPAGPGLSTTPCWDYRCTTEHLVLYHEFYGSKTRSLYSSFLASELSLQTRVLKSALPGEKQTNLSPVKICSQRKLQWFHTLVIILHSDLETVKNSTEQNRITRPAQTSDMNEQIFKGRLRTPMYTAVRMMSIAHLSGSATQVRRASFRCVLSLD